jgi:ABC-type transporter Mla subunit MlaD
MSLSQRKEEAEAVLDSAEMTLETFGETGKKARELKAKVAELEQQLQDPDSERKLEELIEEIRELMEEVQDEPGDEPMMGGPEGGKDLSGGPPPEDDMPPM